MNDSVAYHAPDAVQPKKTPSGWGKLWAALGLGILGFIVYLLVQIAAVIFTFTVPIDLNTLMAVCELFGGALILLFVIALGGKAICKPSTKGMGQAWKAAAWLFIVDGGLLLFDLVWMLAEGETPDIVEGWFVRTLIVAALCLGVGLFEETLMRGLCLNGLLARMGRSTGGVFGAVILSSFFFGMLHYDFFIDYSDPMQIAQNVMKVVQTGMVGYILAAILVKTKNIWTVIVIHAANDFMLMFMSMGLSNEELSTEYVATGEEAVMTLTVYIVVCLLYTPLIVIGTRLIKETGPWRGDFYHYGEAPELTAQPATPLPYAMPGAPNGQYPPVAQAMPPAPTAYQYPAQGMPQAPAAYQYPAQGMSPAQTAYQYPTQNTPSTMPPQYAPVAQAAPVQHPAHTPKHARPASPDAERNDHAQNL